MTMVRVITRKQFLHRTAGFMVAGGALAWAGCGDDAGDDGVAGTTDATTGPTTTGPTTTGPTTTVGTTETTTTGPDTTGGDTMMTTGETDGVTTGGTTGDETAATTMPACAEVTSEVGEPDMGPPHTHMVTVPPEDVAAGAEMTYELSLEAGHTHQVTVTAEMFGMLQMGETVEVDSLEDATLHIHPVTIMCA